MILIRNQQKKIKLNTLKLKKKINKILHFLEYENFALGIWLTTNATIKKFNLRYRKQNKPTDILSFPYHIIKAGEKIRPENKEDYYLGDLIISVETANIDAKKHKMTLDNYILILLTHGICHLLGYKHQTESEFKEMNKLEKKILSLILFN